MPHFIAEYTDNIEHQAELPGVFETVHATLGASSAFPQGGIRSRGVRRMADDYAFVHMPLKVGLGRNLVTRQAVAGKLFDMIITDFAELQAQRLLAFWFEMAELHEQVNFKQNNVQAFLKAQMS